MNWKDPLERDNGWMANQFKFTQPTRRERITDFLTRDRSFFDMVIWILAVIGIVAAFTLLGVAIIERLHIPVEPRQVVADSIGAARYAESMADSP
jgi:hypothetical protein